jgi:L-threonylcarbamoyladenylate synthase
VILPARKGSGLSKQVIRKDGTIALRISSHPAARTLSRRLGVPIVATSANKTGDAPCYSAEEVRKTFNQGLVPDVVLDGGVLRKQKPSTIIKETEEGVLVLRQGSVRLPNSYVA